MKGLGGRFDGVLAKEPDHIRDEVWQSAEIVFEHAPQFPYKVIGYDKDMWNSITVRSTSAHNPRVAVALAMTFVSRDTFTRPWR